ncbi:MAG: hypothetical protein Gyms2KO_33180 [Gymnodinialimonas sp.]
MEIERPQARPADIPRVGDHSFHVEIIVPRQGDNLPRRSIRNFSCARARRNPAAFGEAPNVLHDFSLPKNLVTLCAMRQGAAREKFRILSGRGTCV